MLAAVSVIADFLSDNSSVEERNSFSLLFSSSSTNQQQLLDSDIFKFLPKSVRGIILCGSSVLDTVTATKNLFFLYSSKQQQPPLIFITGGIGHSTHFLYDAVAAHPEFSKFWNIENKNLPEARIFEVILREHFKIPSEFIVVEDKSTNCGQNAEFCVPMISAKTTTNHNDDDGNKSTPSNFLLLQDPTMQRRSRLSFERHCLLSLSPQQQQKNLMMIKSVCVPFSAAENDDSKPIIRHLPYDFNSRYLPLVLGEIPRLRNDEKGYGPKGKNFIGECDIPEKVEEAFQLIVEKMKLLQGEEEDVINSRKI
jgi:hypothetical protein